jgi:predicted nuclease with TOPRIM domain
LADNPSKYEILLNDLTALETQVSSFKNKIQATLEKNKDLVNLLDKKEKEKSSLYKKIEDLENELKKGDGTDFTNLFNVKEKEELKNKLRDLISRINYHLSSDRQV